MTNQNTNQPTPRQTNGRQTQPSPVAAPASMTPPAVPAQPAPAPVTFTEAPSSINLRFDYKGYEGIQLTLRDVSGSQLLHKLDAVLGKLEAMGATPTASKRQTGAPANAAPEANATGEAPPVCQYHGPMKPSKFGGWHCTKRMGDGSYCNEKHP